MSKHTNKYWIREKEFISLKKERDILLWELRLYSSNRLKYIDKKLNHKFFNEYRGMYHTAPWYYRNMLNRRQRYKSKKVVHKILKGQEDVLFEDNYKDAPWYW